MDRGARKQRFHQIGEKGHSPRRAQPGFRTLVPVSSRADSTIARIRGEPGAYLRAPRRASMAERSSGLI